MGRGTVHPAARLKGLKGDWLKGRRIVLGVTGSIAAVEAVHIAHELGRHGADVIPVMTSSATSILAPTALEYATGRAPIIHLSGQGEHVAWMDGPERADLLLIAPATANTLAKIALGVDDTSVTSFATVALGSGVPIVAAPAMHEVMSRNAAVTKRIRELEGLGVTIVPPRFEEGKAKIALPEDLAEACIHRLAKGPWVGRRVLIISGSAAEPLDPVRVVTNRSSGRMGRELALAAHRLGARVTVWNGWAAVPMPPYLEAARFETVADLLALVRKKSIGTFDAVLCPAALSDFAPRAAKQKIPSDAGPVTVQLDPLPKVLAAVRKRAPKTVLVGFKAESDERKLLPRAEERRRLHKAQLVVANTARAFAADEATVHLIREGRKPERVHGRKSELARAIFEAAGAFLPG